MSSIAYITDQNMIEYHRLNGNTSMNFWRPSSSKNISDFKPGDFLFFLAKGSQRGPLREKGIAGYGKLIKTHRLSFDQMWRKFKNLNGYATKEELYEAIVKVTKDKKMPEQLTCMELEEVVFFQSPVYLSDLGMEISNNVESYIYLDRDDMMITSKILAEADQIGVDVWAQVFQNLEPQRLCSDALWSAASNIFDKLSDVGYSEYEKKRVYRFVSEYISKHETCSLIPGSKSDFIKEDNETIIIYIPCLINIADFDVKIQTIIGHFKCFEMYLKRNVIQHQTTTLKLLLNQTPDSEISQLFDSLEIEYEISAGH